MSTSGVPALMHAWKVREPAPIGAHPLEWVEAPTPTPGPGEVLVRVSACGVCRTDLHVAEGDLPVHEPHVTPGHEVAGQVVALGPGAGGVSVGERVGIAWLRHTCGQCAYCRRGAENLCPNSRYTGWDADGGYAQYAAAPADFVYPLPAGYSDQSVAPLLCAGIIGYRALARTGIADGGVLGLYGFGGSAHITAQVALARGCRVHALTRGEDAQRLALRLGCASAGGAYDMPPEPLDAAILFAPVGDIVPVALRALRPGGVLALAGIHLSDVPPLNYERELFHEKELRSVESNTRRDGREFLGFAARHRIRVDTHPYPLDQADRALADLEAGAFAGAAVLIP